MHYIYIKLTEFIRTKFVTMHVNINIKYTFSSLLLFIKSYKRTIKKNTILCIIYIYIQLTEFIQTIVSFRPVSNCRPCE
jgi:hypothetical protein